MASRQPGAPVRRIDIDPARLDLARWPATIPAVAQLARDGLVLSSGITILIGANGAGKSTIVEALAAAWARRITAFRQDWLQRVAGQPSAEDSPLHDALRLQYTRGGPTGGLFLRAERLHEQADGFSDPGRWNDRLGPGPGVLQRSHGEGFLHVLGGMVHEPGLYILDEPESALSFDSSLALVALLGELRAAGSQIVLATHSPVLAATPGATLIQLDANGFASVDYDRTDLVESWRAFLNRPDAFLRHLVD